MLEDNQEIDIEEFEGLFALQILVVIALFVIFIIAGQSEVISKWIYSSVANDLGLVGGFFMLVGSAPLIVMTIYFKNKGQKWADAFNVWASKKYRMNFVKVTRGLAIVISGLGLITLLYGFFFH